MGEETVDLPGFEVLSRLGTGAGSTIYEVKSLEDGRRYALKNLHKHVTEDQKYIDQAINEHEVASQLEHPLLRRSYQLIRRRSMLRVTQLMLLMELVDGPSLAIARPTEPAELVHIFQQVADGLTFMHETGMVHADLKPPNIILTPGGGIKIIDFGQSCPTGTIKQRIQGTVEYIAPEQVECKAITPATDVYNLGATMFWCTTEHHVPRAGSKRGVPGARAVSHDDVPDPRQFNPSVPAALCSLIIDCLRIKPASRPSSGSEVRRRLDLALSQLVRQSF